MVFLNNFPPYFAADAPYFPFKSELSPNFEKKNSELACGLDKIMSIIQEDPFFCLKKCKPMLQDWRGVSHCSLEPSGQAAGICGPSDKANPG